MLLTYQNKSDIDKYYRNTYVKLTNYAEYNPDTPFDPDTLFFIEKVKDDGIYGKTQNGEMFEVKFDEEDPLELAYPLPHKSYFQYAGMACMLARVPARQYKRGISHENTKIVALKENGTIGNVSVGFEPLSVYVKKPMFTRLSVAKHQSDRSVSLSPRMAFVPLMQQMYVDHTPVAVLSENKIKLIKSVFKPEIEALLKEHDEHSLFQIEE